MLKDKGIAAFGSAVAARHLHADHVADIKKMRLSDLLLAKMRVCPLVDEFLRSHEVGDLRHYAVSQHLIQHDHQPSQLFLQVAADPVID